MVAPLLLGMTLAISVPEIDRPVVDLAGVIEASQEDAIARQLVAHRAQTGVQLAVLVVPSTMPDDIADYSQAVFQQWGGGSAQRNDGALFVLAINDRRSRLHLGYGLEPIISDGAAQGMLDDLRPQLAGARYGDATQRLVDDVIDRTAHLEPGEPISAPRGQSRWLWALLGLVALIAGVVWGVLFARPFSGGKGKKKSKGKAKSTSKGKGKTKTKAKTKQGSDGGKGKAAPTGPPSRYPRLHRATSDPYVRIAFVTLVASQALILLLFWHGEGFAFAYTLTAIGYFLVGWMLGGTPRAFGWTMGIFVLGGLILGLVGALDEHVIAPGFDGYDLASHAFMAVFFSLLTGSLIAGSVWAGLANAGQGGSYSSSGYSSSDYSSYSSSSSSSYSSSYSSSSSYDYSGGGGSSGGGGASSSW